MKLNTFCYLVVVGLVISVTLAGKEPDVVDDMEPARSTNFKLVQNWFRRIVGGASEGLRLFGFPLKGNVRTNGDLKSVFKLYNLNCVFC